MILFKNFLTQKASFLLDGSYITKGKRVKNVLCKYFNQIQ